VTWQVFVPGADAHNMSGGVEIGAVLTGTNRIVLDNIVSFEQHIRYASSYEYILNK
jgi:hypothetical protein